MKKIILFSLIVISILGFSQNVFADEPIYGTRVSTDEITIDNGVLTFVNYPNGNTFRSFRIANTSCSTDTNCDGTNGITYATFTIEGTWQNAYDGEWYFGWSENNTAEPAYFWDDNGSGRYVEKWILLNRINGVWSIEDIQSIGITHNSPADNSIDVNAFATFTGTYSNDGTANIIYYKIYDRNCTFCEEELIACQPALIGENLNYTCSYSLNTNTEYSIQAGLISTTLEYAIWDSAGYYDITTGLIYEVQTPATSSTCGTFEFGCHLESALSWFFGVNQNTLNRFGNLTLKNSLPFSYIYDMENLYEELFNDTPQNINVAIAFGSSNLTLLSTEKLEEIPFQGTVRTVLGALMIFGTAMLLYKTLLGIHDKQEVKTTV